MIAFDWVTVGMTLAGLNIVLLGSAGFVWVSNYRQFRAVLPLGLAVFAAAMLVENVVTFYSFLQWGNLYSDSVFAKQFFTGVRGIQLLALAALSYVTWQ